MKNQVKILETDAFYDHVLDLAKQKTWHTCAFSTYGIKKTLKVTKIFDALSKAGKTRKTLVIGFIGGDQVDLPYKNMGIQFFRYNNLHSKFFVFNNGNAVIGSHNLTGSGWVDHSVAFKNKNLINDFMTNLFERSDYSEYGNPKDESR